MPKMKSMIVKNMLAVGIAAALGGTTLAAWAAPSDYDKTFMEKAADAGSTEIAASKLAADRASDPALKAFAKEMVSDHAKVAAQLKQLAKRKDVTLSDAPSPSNQEEIDKLRDLKGDDFDKEYANKIGVSAHKEAVLLFTNATRKASDPDVKAFALKTLPRLQEHIAMATKLKGTMANK